MFRMVVGTVLIRELKLSYYGLLLRKVQTAMAVVKIKDPPVKFLRCSDVLNPLEGRSRTEVFPEESAVSVRKITRALCVLLKCTL